MTWGEAGPHYLTRVKTMNPVSAIQAIIVWVLLLGVHYLDMLLQLKLPPHVPNQNKLCVSFWDVTVVTDISEVISSVPLKYSHSRSG